MNSGTYTRSIVASFTDLAIVIRRWDFSETSQTVSLLTREHGLVRGLAKGAKRERAGFAGGMDLLTEGEVIAIVKPGKDLATLTAWDPRNLHACLRRDLPANRAAQFMVDLVQHLLVDHDPHPGVFASLCAALAMMDDSPRLCGAALLTLQWAVLTEAGFQPQLHRDARSGLALDESAETFGFDPSSGGVVADPGQPAGTRWRVRRETVLLLRDVSVGAPLHDRSPEALHRANRLLASYAREIIGSEPPSMRWAFPDLAVSRIQPAG